MFFREVTEIKKEVKENKLDDGIFNIPFKANENITETNGINIPSFLMFKYYDDDLKVFFVQDIEKMGIKEEEDLLKKINNALIQKDDPKVKDIVFTVNYNIDKIRKTYQKYGYTKKRDIEMLEKRISSLIVLLGI